jgi:transposase-like protein
MDKLDRPIVKQRIRRGQEEWHDIIARFEQSGQTRDRFCTEHNLGLSTFSRWRHQLRRAGASTSPSNSEASFIELEPPAPANLSQTWDVELELGAGMVLRLRRSGC